MNMPDRDFGRCDHFQPDDFVSVVEDHLRTSGVPESEWEGLSFGWGGQLIESPRFKGLYMELTRREKDWVLTRLDRRLDPIPEDVLGLHTL